MNTYDKVALSDRPALYLSAPQTTDKSGTGDFALTSNNLSATGQPIIFGSEFSYFMDSTKTVNVTGNPLFFNDTATFECVIIAGEPTQDVPIVIDDDAQNAVLITSQGVTLKLFFDNALSTYSKSATVRVSDWNTKLYIIVTITNNQATLSVNGQSQILNYVDTIVGSSNVVIGGGYSGYKYLLDGVGFYNNTIQGKARLINDPGSGYSNYVSTRLNGRTTRFEGYQRGYVDTFTLDKFLFSDGQYTLVYLAGSVQEGMDYLTVRANDEKVNVYYDINLDDSGNFYEYLLVGTVDDATLRFVVNAADIDASFTMTIESVYDGDVLYQTPADLVLSGLALYGPGAESIVNYPDGTKLPGAAYTGTWILSDDFVDVPKSVEVVFKPVDSGNDAFVFASTDGQASVGPTGSITGYTAYLNGAVVTDLDDVRYDQWNHLVLTKASPSATEFYLNSDDGLAGDETMSYMVLTGYQTQLVIGDVTRLYEIISGMDLLSVSETASISEGAFENGTAFNAYSFAWAIVGAGGS